MNKILKKKIWNYNKVIQGTQQAFLQFSTISSPSTTFLG